MGETLSFYCWTTDFQELLVPTVCELLKEEKARNSRLKMKNGGTSWAELLQSLSGQLCEIAIENGVALKN